MMGRAPSVCIPAAEITRQHRTEARWRLCNVRGGPARRGLSIPGPGIAVAMLTLLRQPS